MVLGHTANYGFKKLSDSERHIVGSCLDARVMGPGTFLDEHNSKKIVSKLPL